MKIISASANSGKGKVEIPVSFLPLNWDDTSPSVLKKCARLYCQIWQEPPWNETFWEEERVLVDMQNELSRTNAAGFIAVYFRALNHYEADYPEALGSGKAATQKLLMVAGFSWGYAVSRPELNEIAGNEQLAFLFQNANDRVFYIDELGVAKEQRGRGIGRELTSRLLRDAQAQGMKLATLRTDEQALAARRLYSSLGFKELPARDERHPERTYWILPQ